MFNPMLSAKLSRKMINVQFSVSFGFKSAPVNLRMRKWI